MKKYGTDNLKKIAYAQLNPNLESIDGIEQALKNWYCFQYNVPPNDGRLLDMTLEELIILQQMHRYKNNPIEAEEDHTQSYEEWLKTQMGEDYVTDEEQIKLSEQEDKEYSDNIKQQYPDQINTDFKSILGDGN